MALFQHIPGQHRDKPVRDGIIVLAILGFVCYSGFTRSIPFMPEKGTEVQAHFDRATYAQSGTLVRVKGVDVGTVKKVERHPSGQGALVTMRVEEKGFKVKQDAQASIYWRTLLGRNMYVDLAPGSPSAPKLGKQAISISRTQSQVEFDELLDSYDERGRQGVRTFFQEGEVFLDRDDAGEAIERIGPGLRPVTPTMRALRGTKPGQDLPGLVQSAEDTLSALGRDENELASLLDGATVTLGVTAAQRADLAATLQKAPETMREVKRTLVRTESTLDELDPLAQELRPGVRGLPSAATAATSALRGVSALTPDALPLLRDLQPALRRLGVASREGVPLFKGLEPTLDVVKDEVQPLLDERDENTKLRTVEAIGPFFSTLDDSSKQFDRYGHIQRFQPGQGERSIGPLPCKTGLFDPENSDQLISCQEFMNFLPEALTGGGKVKKPKGTRGDG